MGLTGAVSASGRVLCPPAPVHPSLSTIQWAQPVLPNNVCPSTWGRVTSLGALPGTQRWALLLMPAMPSFGVLFIP